MAILAVAVILLVFGARTSQSSVFNILWMAPRDNYNGLEAGSSAGALKLAMDNINSSNGDVFVVNYKDSGCSSKMSLAAVHDTLIREGKKPDVIIGPPCSIAMSFVAQLSGYRNISIIGWVSDSPDFGDKEKYNTMIRVLPPINVIGRGLVEILKAFKWKRAFLLSSSGYPYAQLGTAVNELFMASKKDNYLLTRWMEGEDISPQKARINEVYKLVQKEARIIILAVPLDNLRLWMVQAYNNDMAGGDYVFIYLNGELATDDVITKLKSPSLWQRNDADDNKARKAFESLLILTPQSYGQNNNFIMEANQKGETYAPTLNLTYSSSDVYSPYLYDALRIHNQLAHDASSDYKNGSVLYSLSKSRMFSGSDFMTSPILLDENADRLPNFWLLDFTKNGAAVEATKIEFSLNTSNFIITMTRDITPVEWADGSSGRSHAPPDVPVCGFSNELCLKKDLIPYIVPPVVIGLLIIIALIAFFVNRKLQFERSLQDMGWKLDPDALKKQKEKDHLSILLAGSRASSIQRSRISGIGSHQMDARSLSHASFGRKSGTTSALSGSGDDRSQVFVNVVKYNGTMVALKKLRKHRLRIDRSLLVEMRAMVDLKNHNLAQFIGATVEPPEILEVWEYCSKGSLQDVIWNDNIRFEDMFKYSIAVDLFKGLKYLHDSSIKCHGRLKSSNCVIDGRWTCKLTDYGLFRLREGAEDDPEMTDFAKNSRLLWTAPELLREVQTTGLVSGTSQEGDIYAGSIILKETFARNGPYTEYEDDMEPDEILEKVKLVPDGTFLPFRPSLAEVKGRAPDTLIDVIKKGWSEKPSDRPSASHMVKDLQRINPNRTANVMDNMIKMMERYTNHLEEIVSERTQQVEEEKKKSEMLLYRMLPRPIAEELKKGGSIQAQSYDSVSLYFSDIVQFTALSSKSTPMQVVDLLNGLYTMFDSAIAKHDVYKVETIGDAYMLVSGLPKRNEDRHAVEIANCAMDLLSGILGFKVAHMPDDYVLRIRIGLHTGPTVAGVVGLTMPRYCLFGNTITVAQTMESGGKPMRIQMSQFTYDILKRFSGYYVAARNEPLEAKGLGKINTYWLINKEGYSKPMPDFSAMSAEDCPEPTVFPVTSGREFRPSVTESGIFELDPDDGDQSAKTPAADPDLEQITEENRKEAAPGCSGSAVDVRPDREDRRDDGAPAEGDTEANPEAEESAAVSEVDQSASEGEGISKTNNTPTAPSTDLLWGNPPDGARDKTTSSVIISRPPTASSMRSRFKMPASVPKNDIRLEDSFSDEDL